MEDIIKFVQKRLWSAGHRTKRMPEGMEFDLMVDGKYKVLVKCVNIKDDKRGYDKDDNFKFITILVGFKLDKSYDIAYINKNMIYKNFNEAMKGGNR